LQLENSSSETKNLLNSVSWTVKNIDEPEWPYLLFFTVHETEKKITNIYCCKFRSFLHEQLKTAIFLFRFVTFFPFHEPLKINKITAWTGMTLTKKFRFMNRNKALYYYRGTIFRFMNRKKWAIPVHVPGKITWYTIYGPLIFVENNDGLIELFLQPKFWL
jgi:hypothetical protein